MSVLQDSPNRFIYSPRQHAKLKHVQACLLPDSQYQKSAGFEQIELQHQAASGLNLGDIDITTQFCGKNLKAPLMIAPMTGGTELGTLLNERWARAAEHFGLGFGVGSQRLMLFEREHRKSFLVRRHAPSVLLFANLGAAQIINVDGPRLCLEAIEAIEADALFIHLNPLQEACQEHGDVNLTGLLEAIHEVVVWLHRQQKPVFVREVGFGLSQESAKALLSTGIAGLDAAGAGGTSWAKVEALCADNDRYRRLGELFGEWGIPTVSSIRNVRAIDEHIPLIATGGIRTGLDIAKAIAIGADLSSMAQPMLQAAIESEAHLFEFIEDVLLELKLAMYASGSATIGALRRAIQNNS